MGSFPNLLYKMIGYQNQFIDDVINPVLSNDPKRYAIYHNNWILGLIKALIHTYPVCERITGKRFFEAMGKQYIKTHLSIFFSLNDYGWDFCDFIKNFAPASSLPYLSDVAKLEWLVHKTLLGVSNKKRECVKDIDAYENIKIFLIDNGHVITSEYPIHTIWETNQDDYRGDTIVNLNAGRVWLFVFRKDLEVHIDILKKEEWELLGKIKEKKAIRDLFKAEDIDQKSLLFAIKRLPIFIQKGYIYLEA